MAKYNDIKTILVLGSGPIIIGQAAEFDYAGTQACLALKEEGYKVILVNSNPATIMTDNEIADKIYIEPLNIEFVSKIIRKERPDAMLASLGGQVALNLCIELSNAGILKKYNVRLLGNSLDSIQMAEDRELFRSLMNELNEPVPESAIIHNIDEAYNFVKEIGYPVIVRPAFTMGGSGGGICYNNDDLESIVRSGLNYSPLSQCLLEKSIAGYKEIEYEVMRDANNTAIVVCNMENIDPVGIHTGDSIVVAPSQTLSDKQYHMLRDASLKIIRALKIEGGCNVQLALDTKSDKYYVIEVNPRVSRSSALASKATGYPIAKIAAKISIGLTLDEIINPITLASYSCTEPALDYVVTKIPRFPFDKFKNADRYLGTQMKATGEVMAIGRNFEESLLKAIRSLEYDVFHLGLENFDKEKTDKEHIIKRLKRAGDERLFFIGEALRQEIDIEAIQKITGIDNFFLYKMAHIIDIEKELKNNINNIALLMYAKSYGFSDKIISKLWNLNEEEICKLRKENNIIPTYKMVDTCAGEFISNTPYFYSTYEEENESIISKKEKIIVLGSGPIRIGQGIEFDYATVHAILAIKEAGYEAIVINNNPETVSTDFSISDKLYFEPLTKEDVMNIIDHEKPLGVIVQFGGQTSINLAKKLEQSGVKILGTSTKEIDNAENREKFEKLIRSLNIPQPFGLTADDSTTAIENARKIQYPILARPSYVLGGKSMEIIYNEEDLISYIKSSAKITKDFPLLTDKYIIGKEIEVDAISDGKTVIIPGILEHIERAGIHSGDSIAIYPPVSLTKKQINKIVEYTKKLAFGLNIIGILNIQFVIDENNIYVIEVNPRSSRTVPFLSKITDIPMARIAMQAILGMNISKYGNGLVKFSDNYYTKFPVFSFQKLKNVDTVLGPEMKSTGEVMGYGDTIEKALYKGFLSTGIELKSYGNILFTINDKDKEEALLIAEDFKKLGYDILATSGTYNYFLKNGIECRNINKLNSCEDNIVNAIIKKDIDIIINTTSNDKLSTSDGFKIRRMASEYSVACFTSLDTVKAILKVLKSFNLDVVSL